MLNEKYKIISFICLCILVLTTILLAKKYESLHLWRYYNDISKADVLILGDSISIGYTAVVVSRLKHKANINRPLQSEFGLSVNTRWKHLNGEPKNCKSTRDTLPNLPNLVMNKQWDIIYANWGLWDLKKTSIDEYRKNLNEIIIYLKSRSNTVIIATTTPVLNNNHNEFPADYVDILHQMNNVLIKLSEVHNIEYHDLYDELKNKPQFFNEDGFHLNQSGYEYMGAHVSQYIDQYIGIKPR